MKYIVILVTILSIFSILIITQLSSKEMLPDIKGGFASCTIYKYTAKPNTEEFDINTKTMSGSFKYDCSGNIIDRLDYFNGKICYKSNTKFDKKNRKISSISYSVVLKTVIPANAGMTVFRTTL